MANIAEMINKLQLLVVNKNDQISKLGEELNVKNAKVAELAEHVKQLQSALDAANTMLISKEGNIIELTNKLPTADDLKALESAQKLLQSEGQL